MNRSSRFAYLVGSLAVLLWFWPLARAVSFYQESRGNLKETGSIAAVRDVDFSLDLLHSYTYSVGAALAVVWCLARRPRPAFVLPTLAVLYAGVEVLVLHPEEPIVVLPAMHPYRPAFISLLALLVALAIRFLPRRAA
jgi:hypothetical protein